MRKHFLQAGLILACWTVLALLFIPQTYNANAHTSSPITVWEALLANLILFYTWAALTPLVLWLGRRFPIERGKLVRNLIILILLEVPIIILQMKLLDYATDLLPGGPSSSASPTSFRPGCRSA